MKYFAEWKSAYRFRLEMNDLLNGGAWIVDSEIGGKQQDAIARMFGQGAKTLLFSLELCKMLTLVRFRSCPFYGVQNGAWQPLKAVLGKKVIHPLVHQPAQIVFRQHTGDDYEWNARVA